MNSKTLIRKALSLCLSVAIFATYSMTALAGSEKIAGELLVSGKNSTVTVNGEKAQNGRSIFSSSTISTPADASAIINLGKLGKIEVSPNSVVNIKFTDAGISADLAAGTLTVLGAAAPVDVKTAEGSSLKLGAGESATSGQGRQQDDDDDGKVGGLDWWAWVAIFGGAVAGITIAATQDNNTQLGGGTTVVSTNR